MKPQHGACNCSSTPYATIGALPRQPTDIPCCLSARPSDGRGLDSKPNAMGKNKRDEYNYFEEMQ